MAVKAALRNHATHILQWLNYIPQTNEIRRCAVLVATALIIERRFNLPLIVSELGASAGLNLLFDRFALSSFGFTYQPHKAKLTLTPDWRGPAPPPGRVKIAGHSGSKQDILGISMWPSAQSLGNIFPPNATNCRQAPETAGHQASSATPMAHFSMEADRQGLGAALCFNLWPGEQVIELGRADFHRRWITWVGNRPFKGLS